jgi:hypothetical protein
MGFPGGPVAPTSYTVGGLTYDLTYGPIGSISGYTSTSLQVNSLGSGVNCTTHFTTPAGSGDSPRFDQYSKTRCRSCNMLIRKDLRHVDGL